MEKTEIIEAKFGKLQGYIDEGISIFKGIPYAESPIGELRQSSPVLKTSWKGILEAFEYGPISPQPPPYFENEPVFPQSEKKCLNLNIWTPGCDSKRRAVMFWIHGGSHVFGSGRILNGKNLTTFGDIVLVTINYRLSALGYLYFPETPANIGQLDQTVALQWVYDNIGYFGGDPENITIFGESAGATSVCTLMTMPKAKGLFKRAISQSGAVEPNGFNLSDRKTTSKLILEELNLKNHNLEEFKRLPVEKIMKAMTIVRDKSIQRGEEIDFRPWVDGEILPHHPIKTLNEGYAKDIEFIVGSNLEEWKFWHAFIPDLEKIDSTELYEMIKVELRKIGEDDQKANLIIETYEKSRKENKFPSKPVDIYDAFITDLKFHVPSINCAEAQSRHQKNTYMYLFTWQTPFDDGKYGAMHALEIAFVFNDLLDDYIWTFPKRTDETETISENMMKDWISFAKTGNPNNNGAIHWPHYDSTKRATIILDTKIKISEDPLRKEREMWNKMKIWSQF